MGEIISENNHDSIFLHKFEKIKKDVAEIFDVNIEKAVLTKIETSKQRHDVL